MSGVLALLPLLLLVLVAAVVCAVLVATAQRSSSLAPTVARARRHGVGVGLLAVVAGAVVAVATWAATGPLTASGVDAVLAVVAFGLAHTAVVVAGELTWPRQRGGVRTAALTTRSWRDAVPRALSVLCAVAAASAIVAAVVGWATAAADGRSAEHAWTDASGALLSVGGGPYPGRVYAAPVLVGVVLVAVAVVVAVRTVVARSAVALADPASERALRRASAHRVLRGATATLSALAAGTWGVMGGVLVGNARNVALNDPLEPTAAMTALGVVLVVLGLAHAAVALGVLCWPAPRVGPRVAAPGADARLAPEAA